MSELLRAAAVGLKEKGREVFRAIDLSVEPGDCQVILGKAASGKSKLLRMLYGLQSATSGELTLLGLNLRAASEEERLATWARAGLVNGHAVVGPPAEMAVVFQEYGRSLFPWKTVRENIELPLRYHGRAGREESRRRTEELLQELSIAAHADSRPAELGVSVRRRAALARALAGRPSLLFADEVLDAGDAGSLAATCDVLSRARREWGLALVMAETTPSVVAPLDPVLFQIQGNELHRSGGPPRPASS